jgi:Flp pilus assembly pilin Flp
MTTSAFRPLTEAENIFKQVIWTPMIMAGEVWIEGAVPFLDLPVIKQLDEATISALTDAIYNQLVTLVDVTAIKLVSTDLQNKWTSASEALALIAQEQGVTC